MELVYPKVSDGYPNIRNSDILLKTNVRNFFDIRKRKNQINVNERRLK